MIVGNGAAIIVNGSFFSRRKKKTSLGFEIVPGGAI